MNRQKRAIYEFRNFRLDAAERRLLRDGAPVTLPSKAFDLLLTLVENRGRLVEKDEIFASVWRDQIVEESNLTVHVSQIRKALGETKRNPRFIETVPGYGYRFVGDVSNLTGEEILTETETPKRITIEKETEGEKGRRGEEEKSFESSKISLSQKLAVGAVIILLFAAAGIFWLSNRNRQNAANAPVVLAEKQSNIKRLTGKGTVNHAVLSPDGKFFAYSLQDRSSYRSSLWLGQTSGNSDTQLHPVADLTYNPRSFSADGNHLYYTVSEPRSFDNGTLYKIPVLGGVPQKLVHGISVYVVLSPDEKQIAFVRGRRENKTESLVIADTDGSNEREIVARPAGQSFNSFSLAWSADGARVAFAAASGKGKSQEIFAANAANGSVRQITALEWIAVSRAAWLRDGKGLVIVARNKNSFAENQIWRIDYETGEAQKITRDLQHYGSTLSLSADSNALVAAQATRESSIWVAPAENLAEARQITFGSAGHEGWFGIDWTADGKIVYVARVDQSLTIWTMDTLGANPKQITSAGFLDERPTATADGRYIVFQSNRSGATEIWRVNLDGADLRQLTFDGKNTVPHSAPDGKTIFYTHESDGVNSVRQVAVEGGAAWGITDAECYNARVSPDGKRIACGSRFEGKMKLAIFLIEGGAPVKLFAVPPTYNFDGSIRWTRDGKRIAYRDWANGIWSQPVDGGAPERLEGLPAEKLYNYEWSPDGKQLAFTRGREVRDVVLISDFK